jgi:hypothetical protein
MADSKSGMNLPSRTSFVVSDIKGSISGMRQETSLLRQEWSSLVQTMQSGNQRIVQTQGGFVGGYGGGYGGGGVYGNHVAPDPVFHNAPSVYGGGQNQIAAGPAPTVVEGGAFSGGGGGISGSSSGSSGGGGIFRNLTDYVSQNPGAAALYGMGTALMGANATSDMVQAQLLYVRANAMMGNKVAMGPTTPGATLPTAMVLDNQQNYVKDAMMKMGLQGSVNDKMDTINAVAAASDYGLNGTNLLQGAGGTFEGSVAQGVANVSNLVPGMGALGTMRAYGAMQQGRNVNMLRGVGISIRDADGNLKPPDKIIDDLWTKICRDYGQAYGAGRKPSEREVLIGFQPGNSMDSLVQNLFGQDPLVYNMIKNGLVFKARQTAAGADTTINAANAKAAGLTTEAVQAFSRGNAVATQGLLLSSPAGAKTFAKTKDYLTDLGDKQNNFNPLGVLGLNSMAALLQTLGAAGNGMGEKLIQFLTALLGISGKASGGPTAASNMYMVGEKGPELFVPKVDGTIIPNDKLGPLRYMGGKFAGGDVFAKSVLSALGAPVNPNNLSLINAWGDAENTKAKFNPLATTQDMSGATDFNSSHVKNYKSYQQGVDATVKTLGYSRYKDVIAALKAGNTSLTDFKNIVGSSGWGTWGSSSSGSTGVTEDAATASAITSFFGPNGKAFNAAFQQFLKTGSISKGTTLSSILGSDAAGYASQLLGGGGGSTVNYGGVTFNMNVMGGDPKKIQAAIQQAVKDLQTSKWVATK